VIRADASKLPYPTTQQADRSGVPRLCLSTMYARLTAQTFASAGMSAYSPTSGAQVSAHGHAHQI
jgi:hypothetical protein